MFTGLIQDVGKIAAVSSKGTEASFRIESALAPFIHGESIAVNGACLSVETFDSKSFSIFASAETLNRTGMKNLQTGTPVNLERAMTLNDAVGGHLVSGHVDTRVALLQKQTSAQAVKFIFELPEQNSLKKQIAPKGSVAIDGVSLTVNTVTDHSFELMIIPVTLEHTTLSKLSPGDTVNIETDLIAKYVARFLSADSENQAVNHEKINIELLQKNGFMR